MTVNQFLREALKDLSKPPDGRTRDGKAYKRRLFAALNASIDDFWMQFKKLR